jgi:micrococcal nuclease
MKKKNAAKFATIITAAVVLIGGYLSQGNGNTAEIKQGREAIKFPYSIVKAEKQGIKPFGYISADVIKVTDGDTFSIKYNSKEYKVRMLDVDTPESVKAGVDPQPFSREASNLTKKTLSDKTVKLVFEKDTRDQYGRLLAYVILSDGSFYNAMMVQGGYAISVFYSPNTLLKSYFINLQNQAIKNKKGFWSLPEKRRPFVEKEKEKYIAAYKIEEKVG